MKVRWWRSLRVWVTVPAVAVMAVPVLGMALFAAQGLRDGAMRFEVAPLKQNLVCIRGQILPLKYDRDTPSDPLDRISLEPHCSDTDAQVTVTYSYPGADFPVGPPDSEKVVRYTAEYTSLAQIPDLSLWPFTDPDRITYSNALPTGARARAGSVSDLADQDRHALASVQEKLNQEVVALFGGAVLLISLFGVLVWFATSRVLRPVETIRREVADITEQDLARRIPVGREGNEFARLAVTLNTTLARLHAAVEDNRRFVADASHELRSPIAALRAELEIAHAHPDLADWRAVVDGALRDTYRLQELATDLLLLTRLDDAAPGTPAETADLARIVREQVADRSPFWISVTAEVPDLGVPVRGSRALLARLLANLLDNAEHYATGRISVRLTRVDGWAVLDVADDGPGIPPEHREHVFGRFTRLDEARTRDDGGAGLGLAIARRIASVHRGTLDLVDSPRGAWFTARLPLDQPGYT